MCGICGLVSLPADKSVGYSPTQGDLSLMLEKLTHRGPQGAGVHSSGAATFGTQRLAIRGLDDGLQPIIDEKTGVIVVCNGEIDNHNELRQWFAQRGRTVNQATDVAVLPAMYLECGEAFVEKLEGVFAIALWDPRSEKLILARDRAGERSLFYKRDADVVSFATEVAALAAGLGNDLAPDKRAIAGYLERGSFTAPTSPFLNIKKVRPGEIIVITNDDIRARRYWTWPVRSDNKRQPAPDEFDAIFKNAIRQQSDVDVDFGLFMSGGLDSSLVAAVAKQVHPNYSPPCYTLRFADKSYDEGDFAKEVAQKLGLEMISVPVGPEDFIKDLPRLVRMVGEPLADPAWIPTAMLSQRAAKDVRIVLTGEGADELFGDLSGRDFSALL